MQTTLKDYQSFQSKAQQSKVKWLSDYEQCDCQVETKKRLKNNQAWSFLENINPVKGWLTLSSSVVVFSTPEQFNALDQQQTILNGELLSADGRISWHLRPHVSGDLQVIEIAETQGEAHLVKTQNVKLKSPAAKGGDVTYRLYGQLKDGKFVLITSRFAGLKSTHPIKGEI